MPGIESRRAPARRLLLVALLLALPASLPARPRGAAPAPKRPVHGPRIVLGSAAAGQRDIPVSDLRFVFYERTYVNRRASRADNPAGRRVEVEDRRADCRCLRFEDWSKTKFSRLRQIEIEYPPQGRQALIRVTTKGGSMREVPAGAFFGAADSLAPRFAATVDGTLHEFPLLLDAEGGDSWPEERLLRILFLPTPPPKPPTGHRR